MDGKVIQAGKFDNKSTNEERDALLRTLLETAENADQINDQDEMDDDDLNEIMARSEAEFALFQKIDAERIKNSEYGPGHKYPRLLAEEELPDIYLTEENPVAPAVEEVAGRGARERKNIKYDDGLTEEQWLTAVDGDEETLEETIAKNDARMERLRANREKRQRKAQGLDSSPEPSRETSVTPQQKKRRKGPVPKRKADEAIDDAPSKRKKGRVSKAADSLTNSERATLQKTLSNVYQALMDLEEDVPADSEDSDDEPMTRSVIEPFMKPPPKSQYPDYYMIIQTPMAMDIIKKKINREEYRNLKDFREDIRLLCTNARTYNEDGSILFQDANNIEATCDAELKKETEQHPELADLDDVGSSVGDE
ncbi:conserved hypothetical protein [Microsporum canis CBS 113480]|uniref:Bromo domain-containing protein n=1 Tax=Arthroderma otae (strain ATCC MYA-4605 / CBS 113480) TaxID=554155 RepID=C5FW22_ARTOC|nr:conserved hypothetical protein [Microsporum canis CBS 113480]EEQ34106.1 conserved hypothetical protein [Microsporum canis CBS 113480]